MASNFLIIAVCCTTMLQVMDFFVCVMAACLVSYIHSQAISIYESWLANRVMVTFVQPVSAGQ